MALAGLKFVVYMKHSKIENEAADNAKSILNQNIEKLIKNEFSYKLLAPGYRQRMRMVLRGISPTKGDLILDIGCDEGEYSSMATELGASIVALDIDKDSLKLAMKRAQRKGQKIRFILADAQQLPFKENVFDKAFTTEVLEHVPRDYQAVSEMARVLKMGGEGVIEVPMGVPFLRDPINWLLKKAGLQPIKSLSGFAWGHYRHYTVQQARGLAGKNGFIVLEAKRFNNAVITLAHLYWPELFTFIVLPRMRRNQKDKEGGKPKRALYRKITQLSDFICRLDEKTKSTQSGALRLRVRKAP